MYRWILPKCKLAILVSPDITTITKAKTIIIASGHKPFLNWCYNAIFLNFFPVQNKPFCVRIIGSNELQRVKNA